MADANLVTELGNCKKSAHKTYPKAVLLANLLYEIEDMATNIINDTVEKIVEGVDDEG